jgi:hypothetical protein
VALKFSGIRLISGDYRRLDPSEELVVRLPFAEPNLKHVNSGNPVFNGFDALRGFKARARYSVFCKAQLIAMANHVPFRLMPALADERIVGWDRAVVIESENLSVIAVQC